MSSLWLAASAVAISYCVTWIVRRYALTRQLLDVPNERSSHAVATARGGGLAIVATFMGVLAVLNLMNDLRPSLVLAICAGGALVAVVGFVDDHRHVGAFWRLLVHFLAAACAIFLLFGVPGSQTQLLHPVPLWLIFAIAAVCVVWLTNLYNFMDGIDGIASVEAITVSLGGALVFYISSPATHLWIAPILLLASVAGFLVWNYPPARIFMGDAGSGFLGFVLAVFCLQAASLGAEAFWAWVILLGVFIVDSGVTLVRRLLRGERIHEAHRSHAYQHAARRHGSHASVTLAVGAVNLFWLLPVALLVALSLLDWQLGLLIAYLPLLWLAFRYQSGASTQEM